MNVAIIPARGGSKRIPNKNIKPFIGKPVIHYSIEAALNSGVIDKVIISTDSEKIAKVAEQVGAEVPFTRPAKLADDYTPTAPVLEHAVKWLIENDCKPEFFCCIYATAPFVQPKYLKEAFELLIQKKPASVMSVATFEFPIFRGEKILESGELRFLWPEHEVTRSQDLPEVVHDAGQLYWFDTDKFLEHLSLYPKHQLPLILPRYLVQDIDTEEDWKMAEAMYSVLKL